MSEHSPTTTPSRAADSFEPLETAVYDDGIVAMITVRARDGRVTFSLGREFERGGRTERTAFFKRASIPALRKALEDLEQRIEDHEDKARARKRG